MDSKINMEQNINELIAKLQNGLLTHPQFLAQMKSQPRKKVAMCPQGVPVVDPVHIVMPVDAWMIVRFCFGQPSCVTAWEALMPRAKVQYILAKRAEEQPSQSDVVTDLLGLPKQCAIMFQRNGNHESGIALFRFVAEPIYQCRARDGAVTIVEACKVYKSLA